MSLSIENIVILFLFSTVTALGFLYFRAIVRLREINKTVIDLFFKNSALTESIDTTNTESINDIHKENFIKFLSDSREWAFKYIEEVQTGLTRFIEKVEPEISYYNNYGSAVEGMLPPHDNALRKISVEFEELKKLLPEDIDDRR